jgi:hypothetical protein
VQDRIEACHVIWPDVPHILADGLKPTDFAAGRIRAALEDVTIQANHLVASL